MGTSNPAICAKCGAAVAIPEYGCQACGGWVKAEPPLVEEFGMAIPVTLDFAKEWEETIKLDRDMTRSLHEYMMASFTHWTHVDDWSPFEPKCEWCTFAHRFRHFWHEVERWVAAYQYANRPQCAETRDGLVSVIHHVEECTCHDECEQDD